MDELRLCPFCGGEATMRPEGDYWEITCDDCGVSKQGDTYEQAFKEWNIRTVMMDINKLKILCLDISFLDNLNLNKDGVRYTLHRLVEDEINRLQMTETTDSEV